MMKVLWLLPFQLHLKNVISASLEENDVVLLTETDDFYQLRTRHKNWVVGLMSATRHAKKTFEDLGYSVLFLQSHKVLDLLKTLNPSEIDVIRPTDFDTYDWMVNTLNQTQIPYQFYDDHQFLLSQDDLHKLLKKPYKMDGFYRQLRKQYDVLINQGKPLGGKWSYDALNREKMPKGTKVPKSLKFERDPITESVIERVNESFSNYPGTTDHFNMPVTHEDADAFFEHFLKTRLVTFGDYQDALVHNDYEVSHSLISSLINMGLLDPLTVIKKTEDSLKKDIPLNSVEGFIRQVLGWREYIRGIYLLEGRTYQNHNYFESNRALPHYYWDADTKMACVKDAVSDVLDYGYAHHIKRLMVLGNFASLAGITPLEVNEWFNGFFIDAYDYVVTPNVIGMALHADGGLMATKPYISSGSYIHKMGDHCDHCEYDVNLKTGEKACPFNILYWDYIDRNQDKLASNMRMQIPLSMLKKMDKKKLSAFKKEALILLKNIEKL